MAKQNISFVERHAEKIIIGVTGAVLLAVAVFYLVSTPNKVDAGMGAESLGPGEFYTSIREKTQNVRRRLENAEGPPEMDPIPEDIMQQLSYPTQLARVYTEPLPALPELEEEEAAKVRLARILPPSRPALTTGRGMAELPETETVVVGRPDNTRRRRREPEGLTEQTGPQEVFWVTACAAVNRQQQLQLFKDAQYNSPFLLIDKVEVERQRLGPDGNWLPAEQVPSYRETRFTTPADFALVNDQGQYSAGESAGRIIRNYHENLQENEQNILRPAFKNFLTQQYQENWKLPDNLPGVDLDLEQFKPRETRRARKTDRQAGQESALGRSEIDEKLEQAQRAIQANQYDEARQLLDEATSSPSISAQQRGKANDLRARIPSSPTGRRGGLKETKPDVDLLWVNDITVKPGEVYRYRVRVVVFNQYAGWPTPLQDRSDAAKLVLQGEWSPWSEGITAKADQYIFFAGAQESEQTALVEIFKWDEGTWTQGKGNFRVGQQLEFPESNLSSDLVVADIDYNRNCMIRRERQDGSFSYNSRETSALSLIDPRGQVHEHLAVRDKLSDTRKEIREEIDQQRSTRRRAAR
jgi:hypothetical protein